MAFPESLNGAAFRFRSIERLGTYDICAIAINSYALSDKEIRRALCPGNTQLEILKDSPFSKTVYQVIDGLVNVTTCITHAMLTAVIIPKNSGLRQEWSKAVLYDKNLATVIMSIESHANNLADMRHDDPVIIEQIASNARINMERALKIECCYREIFTAKNYSQLLLGDLWGCVKKFHSDPYKTMFGRIAELANKLSHDSGQPVLKSEAEKLCSCILQYTIVLRQEVFGNYKARRYRRRDENYIAF